MNIATFLDPRYKDLPFLESGSKQRMLEDIKDELLLLDDAHTCESTEQEESMSNAPPAKKHKGPVSKLLGELFENEQPSCHSDKVSNEIEIYKAVKPAELDSDPLAWWNTQTSVYPLMSQLVKKVFCFVATSVASERLFSSAGNVITEQCNRLTSEHADQLIFLFENNS